MSGFQFLSVWGSIPHSYFLCEVLVDIKNLKRYVIIKTRQPRKSILRGCRDEQRRTHTRCQFINLWRPSNNPNKYLPRNPKSLDNTSGKLNDMYKSSAGHSVWSDASPQVSENKWIWQDSHKEVTPWLWVTQNATEEHELQSRCTLWLPVLRKRDDWGKLAI